MVEVKFHEETGIDSTSDVKEQTFNERPSSTKKPALLNEWWMKSEWGGQMNDYYNIH